VSVAARRRCEFGPVMCGRAPMFRSRGLMAGSARNSWWSARSSRYSERAPFRGAAVHHVLRAQLVHRQAHRGAEEDVVRPLRLRSGQPAREIAGRRSARAPRRPRRACRRIRWRPAHNQATRPLAYRLLGIDDVISTAHRCPTSAPSNRRCTANMDSAFTEASGTVGTRSRCTRSRASTPSACIVRANSAECIRSARPPRTRRPVPPPAPPSGHRRGGGCPRCTDGPLLVGGAG